MKILLPVDGSDYTKHMLAYLAAHDEWLGAHHEYTVLTVSPPLPSRAAAALSKEIVASYHADEAEKVFKPIRTFFGRQGLNAEFVTKTGHPAEVIAAMADKGKFDLVMLGSHGHGALTNLVLGSVATKVLAARTVPVLFMV